MSVLSTHNSLNREKAHTAVSQLVEPNGIIILDGGGEIGKRSAIIGGTDTSVKSID